MVILNLAQCCMCFLTLADDKLNTQQLDSASCPLTGHWPQALTCTYLFSQGLRELNSKMSTLSSTEVNQCVQKSRGSSKEKTVQVLFPKKKRPAKG